MKRLSLFIILITVALSLFQIEGATKSKAKKAVDPDEVLEKGREAFLNYEFEEAADLFDQYKSLKNKAKQPLTEDFEEWEAMLDIAGNAFERVQKIVIVDSISVPRGTFFESYNLASSAGRIGKPSSLGIQGSEINEIAFLNEAGDYLLVPEPNESQELRIMENRKLINGEWVSQEALIGDFEKTGDYAYPFLSADGQTLYFSNNGEESMGGFDLFIAQKDPITGEYRQPLNLGMPFNSPYDDLMMAIDEENGIGWWATDRHSAEGDITIYVYLIEDIRKNYPSDTENLANLAKITDYKATWVDDKNEAFQPIMPSVTKTLNALGEAPKNFTFSLGNGKTYYNFIDFRNRKAADVMKQYVEKNKELTKKVSMLADLRSEYKQNRALESKIIKEETEIEELREQAYKLRNEVLRLEKSVR